MFNRHGSDTPPRSRSRSCVLLVAARLGVACAHVEARPSKPLPAPASNVQSPPITLPAKSELYPASRPTCAEYHARGPAVDETLAHKSEAFSFFMQARTLFAPLTGKSTGGSGWPVPRALGATATVEFCTPPAYASCAAPSIVGSTSPSARNWVPTRDR